MDNFFCVAHFTLDKISNVGYAIIIRSIIPILPIFTYISYLLLQFSGL